MASSNADLKKKVDTLRREILSYKPGKAVSCDDERVVSPYKFVVGMIEPYGIAPTIVPALRRALHGDVKPSKHADKQQTFTKDQEQYLTDSISVITKTFITGRIPLDAIFRYGGVPKARNKLKQPAGSTDMYEIPQPDGSPSDDDQLQLLDLLRGCLYEGDRTLAANDLKKMCTNPRCTLFYEKTKKEVKEAKEANQKMFTEVQEQNQELKKGREEDRERSEKEQRLLAADMTKKLESKQQQVDTLTEIVGEKERNETTLTQQVEELKKGREEDRERAEKEKRSLASDTTKKLESKQQQVDILTEIVGEKGRNETTLRQQVEELKKGREEDRARLDKDKRSIELSWKKEHDYKEHLEQLERETWKLRTKIQLESEIRSAEQKKKAETHQLSFISRFTTAGKQTQGGKTFFPF
ncbi:inner centromere protein-like [Strongylocentrotus purpuratus]|uniref:Uncharacterized protein n=1 Tax=Strongylocentrotus purpuratus TaxID=7668 RepID=A0A7M7T4F9_STRPU|nr:inner centromere protein-like [Strongylocentrotus purpuratus]